MLRMVRLKWLKYFNCNISIHSLWQYFVSELRKLLIYSWKSKVVSICTGIIIVHWLSPSILINFITKFDPKTEPVSSLPSTTFISSYNISLLISAVVYAWVKQKQNIQYHYELSDIKNLNNEICLNTVWFIAQLSMVAEVVPKDMLPTMQLPASSENTTLSLSALQKSV
jgi:uncharacterized membrane protein YeiB